MSVSRPARCLFSLPSVPAGRQRTSCRSIHISPRLCERRRARHNHVKPSEGELPAPRIPAKELFKPYTEKQKEALSQKYTSAQLRAIEAGEKALTAEDLDKMGVIRTDPERLSYLNDLSVVHGVIDKKIQADEPIDPTVRLMTEEEYTQSLHKYLKQFEGLNGGLDRRDPEQFKQLRPNRRDVMEALSQAPKFMSAKGPVRGQSAAAPAVPKFTAGLEDMVIKEPEQERQEAASKDTSDDRDPEGIFDQLRKQTGYDMNTILSLKSKVLVQNFVSNQTRLGKVQSIYILAIAGDGNGRLGIGQAKGQDIVNTKNLARISAIKNLQPVPRYEGRTIFGEVEAKVSACEVRLMSRPPGFGLRCQHLIFEMARAAGIHDLAARVPRSRNKMNTVKAAYEALMKQRIPNEVAIGRGLKMVDVRKVYYGGRV